MNKKLIGMTQWGLWAGLVLMLPITSMPMVANLVSSGTTVAPPAGIFLLILIVVWFIPALIKKQGFPIQTLPLIGFALFVIIDTLLSAFYLTPPYKTNDPFKNGIEAMVTLAIGISFYFVVTLWLNDRKKFEQTIRLINWSGVVILLWAAIQIVSWMAFNRYPDWVRFIHEFYSNGPLYRQRVSGFAFEPSWFAHQLNMLYLPLWLALSVQRVSLHRLRIWRFTLENMLLVGGLAALFLSYSRIGLAAFLLMVAYVLLRANLAVINRVQKGLIQSRFVFIQQINPKIQSILIGCLMVLIYLALLAGLGLGLSRLDPRMAKLFTFDPSHPDGLFYYANDLTFASRLVYWQAGWNIFEQFPWLGVGLGKAGFYLTQNISMYGWRLVEVRDLVYRSVNLLNIKSLWVRLLAETGIVGFSLFISWLWGLWQTSKITDTSKDGLIKALSWMGKFVIIGLVLEGFSVDTFALPYFWFSLGMLTAIFVFFRKREGSVTVK